MTTPPLAEQLYAFDVQGYVVLRDVVPPDVVARALELVEEAAGAVAPGGMAQVDSVHELSPDLDVLIDLPAVVELVAATSAGAWRLNHTYALVHEPPNRPTPLHGGGTPLANVAAYDVRNGRIMSTLTKAVFPLVDCGAADGTFGVVPGSHKSGIERPPLAGETAHPLVRPVETRAGDCIVFTEALCHGSVPASSDRGRRTLYYCYSAGWMRDWPGLDFRQGWIDGLSPARREIVAVKGLG